MKNKVAIVLGSETDKKFFEPSEAYWEHFSLNWELHIMSAHRNPLEVAKFAQSARSNGYGVLVGAAGMAAHLAGALKSNSTLPVLGVPLPGGILDGLDSLMATLQMPKGLPVATLTVGKHGFINAAILCAEIFALNNQSITDKLDHFKANACKI